MFRRLFTVLSALSLLLCAGCVYIPATDAPARKGGPDPNRLIGGPASGKPVRPGAVTREQVIALLGEPHWRLPEGQSFGYGFKMKAGYWVVLPLFQVVRADRKIAARLDFGPDGILCAVKTERGGHSPMHFLGPVAPTPRMWWEFMRWPATQAATTRAVTPPPL